MRADTILVIGVATVLVGNGIFLFTEGFDYFPVPLVGLIIICIAIIKQKDEHTKW